MSKEQLEKVIIQYKLDTTKLSDEIVDCEVLFLIGTKSDKRIIIVDSDNDEDFGDEQILEYEYPLSIEAQTKIEESLPVVSTKYEYFENNQLKSKEVEITPSPYKGSLRLTFNTDNQTEKKYFLFASFPEYKQGDVMLNDMDYKILASNGFTGVNYPTDRVSLFITPVSDLLPSELDDDIPKVREGFYPRYGDRIRLSISRKAINDFKKLGVSPIAIYSTKVGSVIAFCHR